jgi:DNA-binding FrmR family transcriptional regulator
MESPRFSALAYASNVTGHGELREREKVKLLNGLKRLRGQVDAIERALAADGERARVLQLATSRRARWAASSPR